jgi:hypothetical protein
MLLALVKIRLCEALTKRPIGSEPVFGQKSPFNVKTKARIVQKLRLDRSRFARVGLGRLSRFERDFNNPVVNESVGILHRFEHRIG